MTNAKHVYYYNLRGSDDSQPCYRQTTGALPNRTLSDAYATFISVRGLSIDRATDCTGSYCEGCADAARSARR